MLDQFTLTLPEILSLVGLVQCVYLLVYISFRAGNIRYALIPIGFFLCLGAGYFLDMADRYIHEISPLYDIWQWAAWAMIPPLSVLLAVQITRMTKLPDLMDYGVLFIVPVAYVVAFMLSINDPECIFPKPCDVLSEWLLTTGVMAGGFSLLLIWFKRDLFSEMRSEKAGKDRYWLILTLIFANIFLLAFMMASLTGFLSPDELVSARNIMGLALLYLTATSLFRIYPLSIPMKSQPGKDELRPEELALARKIENLLNIDKIYQEPSYGRSDLARELGEPETKISKIISAYFGKTFPQILNERRVEDAKILLKDTEAAIAVIAKEAGFNSLASFNRVFRDVTGQTPSAFRKTG